MIRTEWCPGCGFGSFAPAMTAGDLLACPSCSKKFTIEGANKDLTNLGLKIMGQMAGATIKLSRCDDGTFKSEEVVVDPKDRIGCQY